MAYLDRENTIAPKKFNRWLIPPTALSIHLAIGQAYSLSVFNLPMSKLLGISESTSEDWGLTTTIWIFNIAFFFLGLSAALFGKWVERSGPRKAMLTSAICFSTGFLVSALGVYLHIIYLVYLGYGVLGGIGLGIGYISPVSTLIKWFPDRPGMATGLAIMGFGGGAMIGSPLAVGLMDFYATPVSMGVWQTFLTMGLIYFSFMMFGVINVRVPAADWKPEGFVASTEPKKLVTTNHVLADQAIKTPQFWMLWIILCFNVTAGIGVLGQASPMIQEMFPGKISTQAAAGFVGLLSLFNLVGRFVWSSFSDLIGRKNTYFFYLGLGLVLYSIIPTMGKMETPFLFVLTFCIIISMYGGGFSTIPAYLRDLFGTLQVGAIHGRLLTAWSTAAIIGPSLVTYIREYQINAGVAKADAYTITMYVMAGFLFVGLISNYLVKAVSERYHYKESKI